MHNCSLEMSTYLIKESKCFHKRFELFIVGKIYAENSTVYRFGLLYTTSKRNQPNLNPKSQICSLEKEITNSRGHLLVLIWKYESPVISIIPFGNMLFPMLTAEQLHLLLYFCTECHNFIKNIIFLFCKYLVDLWEKINGKLFVVYSKTSDVVKR